MEVQIFLVFCVLRASDSWNAYSLLFVYEPYSSRQCICSNLFLIGKITEKAYDNPIGDFTFIQIIVYELLPMYIFTCK